MPVTKYSSRKRNLAILVFCVVVVACAEQEDDYCRDHFLFHEQHRAVTGTFEVRIDEDGRLTAELLQPVAAFPADGKGLAVFVDALAHAENVYSAGSSGQCSTTSESVIERDNLVTASYESRCNTENILKEVDVSIFDFADDLDEIVVTITTPATSKHFAISRQCSAAIFRLQRP